MAKQNRGDDLPQPTMPGFQRGFTCGVVARIYRFFPQPLGFGVAGPAAYVLPSQGVSG